MNEQRIVVNMDAVRRRGEQPVFVEASELFAGIEMPFGLVIPAAYESEDEYNAVVAAEIASVTGEVEVADGDDDSTP